jgi:hypothetical protein
VRYFFQSGLQNRFNSFNPVPFKKTGWAGICLPDIILEKAATILEKLGLSSGCLKVYCLIINHLN